MGQKPKQHEGVVWRPNRDDPDAVPYARITWTENGKLRSKEKRARNVTDAKALRDKMLRDLRGHGSKILDAEKMTFAELAERYKEKFLVEPIYAGDVKIEGQRAWKKQRNFLKPLINHFGTRYISQISYDDLRDYRKDRYQTPLPQQRGGGQRSITCVNRELSLLSAIFRYACRIPLLARSPFEMGEPLIIISAENERDRILSLDEEKRLLPECRKPYRIHLYYLVVAALETAARLGELLRLRWSEVDFETGMITLRSYKGKKPKSRTFKMTEDLIMALKEWCDLMKPKNQDSVFCGFKSVDTAFNKACADAKIKDLNFHDLRHTATTRMIEDGMELMLIMKITGHTQMKTFQRYINLHEELAKRIAEKREAARKERLSTSESTNESIGEFIN
jgi:integrase